MPLAGAALWVASGGVSPRLCPVSTFNTIRNASPAHPGARGRTKKPHRRGTEGGADGTCFLVSPPPPPPCPPHCTHTRHGRGGIATAAGAWWRRGSCDGGGGGSGGTARLDTRVCVCVRASRSCRTRRQAGGCGSTTATRCVGGAAAALWVFSGWGARTCASGGGGGGCSGSGGD